MLRGSVQRWRAGVHLLEEVTPDALVFSVVCSGCTPCKKTTAVLASFKNKPWEVLARGPAACACGRRP